MIIAVIFGLTAWLTAAEMATFSARPERMRQAVESGNRNGTDVLVYQRSPVSFLAAGQVIATGASLFLGTVLQAQITPDLATWIQEVTKIKPSDATNLAGIINLVIFTILSLIITNVIPKQIGFDHADRIALKVAKPFRFLIKLTRPIAWIVTRVSQIAEGMVNRKVIEGHRVTEHDLNTLIAEGLRLGTLDPNESKFVHNALRLSDVKVEQIASPILEGNYLLTNKPVEETHARIIATDHSYMPVFANFPDQPLGTLKTRTWLAADPQSRLLGELIEPVTILEHSETAVDLFRALSVKTSRVVLIRKEGQIIGLITLNDAVAQLAGNLKALRS
jgi:putative hemolysin